MPSKPPSARLRQLLKLARRKEALLAQLQDIDRAMVRLEQEFRTVRSHQRRQAPVTVSRGMPHRRNAAGRKRKRASR